MLPVLDRLSGINFDSIEGERVERGIPIIRQIDMLFPTGETFMVTLHTIIVSREGFQYVAGIQVEFPDSSHVFQDLAHCLFLVCRRLL